MWLIPVFFRIIFAYLIAPGLIKKMTDEPARTRKLVWQFGLAAIFAVGLAVLAGANLADPRIAIVLLIGAVNAFACYCQWRAMAISLSKTSIFTQADDLIAIGLGYIFLNEASFVGLGLGIGIALAIGSALLLSVVKSRGSKNSVQGKNERSLLMWVGAYSLIWGGAMFSYRWFAVQNVSPFAFMAAWYAGSFVGAVGVYFAMGKEEAGRPLTRRQTSIVACLAVVIVASNLAAYWTTVFAPITVAQPIFQIAEMVFPTLIGLYVFKEKKDLGRIDKLAFAVGMAGGVIIALSY